MPRTIPFKFAKQQPKSAGFTLIEVIAVLVLLGILAGVAVSYYIDLRETARIRAIDAAVAELNGREKVAWGQAMLQSGGNPDDTTVFGYVAAESLGADYSWQSGPQRSGPSELLFQGQVAWLIRTVSTRTAPGNWRVGDSLFTIGLADGLRFGESGWSSSFLSGSYGGSAKNILIPTSLEETALTQIWQDVFNGKDLQTVEFSGDSAIVHIHARAFRNNQLTDITLPPNLQRIDQLAFDGNPITSVVLPDSVTTIERNAFTGLERITVGNNLNFTTHPQGNHSLLENAINGSNAFRDAYLSESGGAGTYVWDGTNWIKLDG